MFKKKEKENFAIGPVNWLNLSSVMVAVIASLWGGLIILASGIRIFAILSKFTYYNMNGNFLFETNVSFQLIKWLVLLLNGFFIYIFFSVKDENGKKKMKISRAILIFVYLIPSIAISGKISIILIPLIGAIIIIAFKFIVSQLSLKKWLNTMFQKQPKIASIIIYVVMIPSLIISGQCIWTWLEQISKKEFLIITYETKDFMLVYQNENYSYVFSIKEAENQIDVLEIDNSKLIQINNNNYIEMTYKKYNKVVMINS